MLTGRAHLFSFLIVAAYTVQERPTTKEVVTYVQENRPFAKQVCIHLQAYHGVDLKQL